MYNWLHMEKNLANSVKKALKLIQSGKADAARPILLEVLKQDEKIEQAWYLLSFTLPPGEKQEYALNQALRFNPDFDRASQRLDKLKNKDRAKAVEEAQPKSPEPQEPVKEKAEQPEAGAPEPEKSAPREEEESRASAFPTDTFIDGVDMEVEEETKKSPTRWLVLVGLIVVVLLIVIIVASSGFLGNLFGGDQVATSTVVQGFRTLPPTWTP